MSGRKWGGGFIQEGGGKGEVSCQVSIYRGGRVGGRRWQDSGQCGRERPLGSPAQGSGWGAGGHEEGRRGEACRAFGERAQGPRGPRHAHRPAAQPSLRGCAGEASLALRRPETLRSPSPGTDWTLRLPLSQRCTQCLQERQGSRSDSARGLPPPWRCLCALLTKDGACWKERSGAMDTGSRSLPETKGTARRGQGGASGGCL